MEADDLAEQIQKVDGKTSAQIHLLHDRLAQWYVTGDKKYFKRFTMMRKEMEALKRSTFLQRLWELQK